jgi:hypothetical protein
MTNNPIFLVDGVHPHDNPAYKNLKDGVSFDEIVKKEMVSQGLNPINIDDVRKFWASKGVAING